MRHWCVLQILFDILVCAILASFLLGISSLRFNYNRESSLPNEGEDIPMSFLRGRRGCLFPLG